MEHKELRRDYLRSRRYNIVEIWERNWCERVKEEETVRNHLSKNLPFKLPMRQESFLAKKEMGKCLDIYNYSAISKFQTD